MHFEVDVKFPKIILDHQHVNVEMALLTKRVEAGMVNYVKLALVAYSKIATGDTINSIRPAFIANKELTSPNGYGFWLRKITGDYGLKFIISGRRPGAKMPVRLVSGSFDPAGRGSKFRGAGGRYVKVTGRRGGRQFEPVPAMLRWFLALNIPRNRWFPIMRAIAKRGIKPVDIRGKALQDARPMLQREASLAAMNISRGLIKVVK